MFEPTTTIQSTQQSAKAACRAERGQTVMQAQEEVMQTSYSCSICISVPCGITFLHICYPVVILCIYSH